MATGKKTELLLSRNKQPVTSPRKVLLKGKQAKIKRQDKTPVVFPKKPTWQLLMASLGMCTDDLMEEGRQQPRIRKRRHSFRCGHMREAICRSTTQG